MSAQAVIESLTPGLRTDITATDAATGQPIRLTTYRGYTRLSKQVAGVAILRPNERLAVQFFLPDSLPYERAPSAVDAQTFLRYFYGGRVDGPQGALEVRVAVEPDPRGGPNRWVQLSFGVSATIQVAEIGYLVTVATSV